MSLLKELSTTGSSLLSSVRAGATALNTGMLASDNTMHILLNTTEAGRIASEFWKQDIATGAAIQHQIRKVTQEAELQEHLNDIANRVDAASHGPVIDVTAD